MDKFVVCHFDANQVDRTVRLNSSALAEVREIYLVAVSYKVPIAQAPHLLLDIENGLANCISEGESGFPVFLQPGTVEAAGATRVGAFQLNPPIKVAEFYRSAVVSFRVRLSNVSGAALVHDGISFWFVFRSAKIGWEADKVRAAQYFKPTNFASDYYDRWDYSPQEKQQAADLAKLLE